MKDFDFSGLSVDELRQIKERIGKEIEKNEYAIAYRISSDGDFHFMKKARTRWHHKRGSMSTILTESEDNVLNSIWCDRYDGPIVLMAMRRE